MMMKTSLREVVRSMAAAAIVFVLATVTPARAAQALPYTCPEQIMNEVQITPPDGNVGGYFGWYADVEGDLAVVSAPGDDDDGVPNAGAIYVYHRDSSGVWNQEGKLRPMPPQLGDLFGQTVAVSGDTVAVGAPGTTINGLARSGAVYVYRRDGTGGWSLEAFITPIDPGPQIGPIGDQFGYSVDLRGSRIVAGATHDDDIAWDAGAAYVFDRVGTTWTQTAKLHSGDGAGQDFRFFGNDVAVDANSIAVGLGHDVATLDRGAVYAYDKVGSSWVETKLVASDGHSYDQLGSSVAINGSSIVAGAPGDDDSPSGSQSLFKGSAYVFEKNGLGVWTQKAKLQDPNGTNSDYFGSQVAIAGGTIILGNVEFSSAFGTAHVYRRNSSGVWKLLDRFTASDNVAGDSFGSAVSASGRTLMVGAFGQDGVTTNSGSVYFYSIEEVCPTAP